MSERVKYVGIGGSGIGVGKSTFTKLFCKLYNYQECNFGDALKEEIIEIFQNGFIKTNNGTESSIMYFIREYAKDAAQASRLFASLDLWSYNFCPEEFTEFINPTKEMLSRSSYKETWFREWMQWWGTDVRRQENPDYWLDKIDWTPYKVFGDLRFINETEYITSNGGKTIYLSGVASADTSHISESLKKEECTLSIYWDKSDRLNCYRYFCQVCTHTRNPIPSYEEFNYELTRLTGVSS